MDDGSTFMIVALIVLIGLSAFFSAAETAYNSLNEIRLKSKADDGDEKAAHTLALVERYDVLIVHGDVLSAPSAHVVGRTAEPPANAGLPFARLRRAGVSSRRLRIASA